MSAVAHIDEYKTGRFYTDEFRGSLSWNGYEHNVLLRNEGMDSDGIPHFSDVAMALGADDIYDSRGVAVADYDNDGDLDIAVNHSQGDNPRDAAGVPPSLWRNDIGGRRQWLAVELVGTRSNRQAVGAVVQVVNGERSQTRLLSAGSSYSSQQGDRLYFGLDDQGVVERLLVIWPSGIQESFESLPANSLVRITESAGFEVGALPGETG